MKCKLCGHQLEEGAVFCRACGFVIEKDVAKVISETQEVHRPAQKKPNFLFIGALAIVAVGGIIMFTQNEDTPTTSNYTEVSQTTEQSFSDTDESEDVTATPDTTEDEIYDITEGGIHRYEYYVDDCSWNDAYVKAINSGGYLVRINSPEEYDYIISEIEEYCGRNLIFRIGARRNTEQYDYYWVDENNKRYGLSLNNSDYWSVGAWKSGEPNYMDGDIVEAWVEIYYNEAEARWVWNDIPDDLIAIAPYYSGRVGYIVEYED